MTFVSEILAGFAQLSKSRKKFLLAMFSAFFVFRGRANCTNLYRYGAPSPRAQYRQSRKPFDFLKFNLEVFKKSISESKVAVAAIDISFIHKSGIESYGVGNFWNGCLSRSMKGQAISLIAGIDLSRNTALTLSAEQVPPKDPNSKKTQVDFSVEHYEKVRSQLSEPVIVWLADGEYANQKFVGSITNHNDILVSKLRVNASMRHLYRGPRRPGPGRPRKFDGKVINKDIDHWTFVEDINSKTQMFTNRFWHDTFKMEIRVVMLRHRTKKGWKMILLFSTDVNMEPMKVYQLYSSRFQIEFIFRDAKQHTGLEDAQVRDAQSLDFHFNLSLASLNVLRAEEIARGHEVLSIASARRRKQNEDFMLRIFSALDIEPTSPVIQPHLPRLIEHGLIAA